MVNLKMNSKTELILLANCHKASLWNLYGNRFEITLFQNEYNFKNNLCKHK